MPVNDWSCPTSMYQSSFGGANVLLSEVEKLVKFAFNTGLSNSDLCKYLVLETFSHLKASAIYTAEITNDGYLSPLGTFGIPEQTVASWGNIPLNIQAPLSDAVRDDKCILLKREESAEKYPILATYDGVPENWESYLVTPVLPHGLIALTLNSTPKIDKELELFLSTVTSIALQHFFGNKYDSGRRKQGVRDKDFKKDMVLSERQLIIKSLIEKGFSNPQIAAEIGYSESLVRQETMAIYAALNISGRRDLLENSGG